MILWMANRLAVFFYIHGGRKLITQKWCWQASCKPARKPTTPAFARKRRKRMNSPDLGLMTPGNRRPVLEQTAAESRRGLADLVN